MATKCPYNIFVGAETGLLKGVQVADGTWQNLNAVSETNRSKEITSLCWEENKICAGCRDNCILTYDASGATSEQYGPVFGVSRDFGHIKTLKKFKDSFLIGFTKGIVAVWSGNGDDDDDASMKIETGDNMWALAQSVSQPNLIATGGKENPLKVWDLTNEGESPIFSSKNVKNDWLNLRVPIWVTQAQFLHGGRRVMTGTGYSQVRVYDILSSQRRPVMNFKFLDSDCNPITAMSVCAKREDQVVVGNTMGDMGLLDVRKGRVVQLYKGFSGGITDIQCHQSAPVIISCGVDRHLRVHDLESRALLKKIYLKSRLNCLLLADDWPEMEENSSQSQGAKKKVCETDTAAIDDMWDSLESVKTKTIDTKDAIKTVKMR